MTREQGTGNREQGTGKRFSATLLFVTYFGFFPFTYLSEVLGSKFYRTVIDN
ncbi:MAG: hypothetical protein ACK6A9_07125 [Dolichospermum sp.]